MRKSEATSAVRVAAVSLVLCGLVFPLVVTGLAQALFPTQAGGSLVTNGSRTVGSALIAQTFTSPAFFHPRNDSASGVDPDITLQDALSQVPRISQASGIPQAQLMGIVNAHQEGTFWVFGAPYVNVLELNLALIDTNQQAYSAYSS